MKYRVSHLPNTQHAVKFRITSPDFKKEIFFNFSKPILELWRNPLEDALKTFMVAYIKRHGWEKNPVNITTTDSPKDMNHYLAQLEKPAKA